MDNYNNGYVPQQPQAANVPPPPQPQAVNVPPQPQAGFVPPQGQPQPGFVPPQGQPQPGYVPPQGQPQPGYVPPQAGYMPPQPGFGAPQGGRRLDDDISFGKLFGLSLVTCGIYSLIYYAKRSDDLNFLTERYYEKPLMNFWLVYLLLSTLTCGILPLVWMHKFCTRIGEEADRRGVNTGNFSASTFWLWGVLGSLFIAGPYIFQYKLNETMNAISRDYNARGFNVAPQNPGFPQF